MVMLTAALTFLVFRPSNSARFTASSLESTTCPEGSGVPVCYKTTVKNTGGQAAPVRCVLTPATGSQAIFDSGSATYLSPGPIEPSNGILMLIKVDAADGGTISAPTIACSST
jgi:hypothetical protein